MICFILNGQKVSVDVAGSVRLLYVLRNHLGQKGAKFGCGLGQCGACTVLIDGNSTQACDVAADFVVDRAVTTVEGLSEGGRLHPLQQAFLEEQAAQCGYCTAGILMSAKGLLDSNPNPTRADIVAALSPNLCRCGAHQRIIRAIERAARTMCGKAP
jgi:nicotinate dehydrogenase subunit A